ncbi:MAG: ABC transporter substrate-binding protein [Paludibacter sp.]
MKSSFKISNILIGLFFLISSSSAVGKPTNVTLQLKWKHQFQFAGYYAAIAKGFYQEKGITVNLQEAMEGVDPNDAVVNGKADFGVCTTDILLLRSQNKKVVVLSTIFQHSPQILVASKKSGIEHVHNLIGKRIAMEHNAVDIIAFMKEEGIALDKCVLHAYSFNPNNLIEGKIDAATAYLTDEPFELNQAHFDYNIISPSMGGIDFYGDLLYTTEGLIKSNPELVENFRKASLKGWKYAMEHPEEIINFIYNNYGKRHSLEHLRFEAEKMKNLILPDVVEIGYSNPGRWESILDAYKKLDMIDASFKIDGMMYSDYVEPKVVIPWALIGVIFIVFLVIVIIALVFYRSARNLKKEINNRHAIEKDLLESNELFHSIIKASPEDITITDLEGIIIMSSPAALSLFGYKNKNDFEGHLISEFIVPEDRQRAMENVVLMFQGIMTGVGEYRGLRADGTCFDLEVNAEFIRDPEGKPIKMIYITRDISDRKLVEERLKQSEQNYRMLIETANEGIAVSYDMYFKYVNPRMLDLTGRTQEELMSIPYEEFIHPDDREFVMSNKAKRMAGNVIVSRYQFRFVHKDGSIRWMEMSGAKIEWENKPAIINFITDITERKEAEQQLSNSQEQLKNFAAHLQNVREEERALLAREIHDELGQILVAVKIDMGMLRQKVIKCNTDNENNDVLEKLNQLYILVDNTIKTTRRIMTGLRPEVLELLGFVETTKIHLTEFQNRYSINTEFHCNVMALKITDQQSVALFRILQESLLNVSRHAEASLVKVEIKVEHEKLIMKIVDNGKGFDENNKGRSDSYGMIGMKERVFLLDEQMTISGKIGKGTTVRVEIPYKEPIVGTEE